LSWPAPRHILGGMSPRLRQLLVLAVAAAVLCGWWLYLRSPDVQVPRTFARIKQAVDGARGGMLVDQLHPSYSIKACWPGLVGDLGIEPSEDQLRAFAQTGIQMTLRGHADDPLVLTYEIHRIEPQDDGTVAAEVTIQIGTRSGQHAPEFEPHLVHQRFVLERSSFPFPALYIKSHKPFTVNL
jgi:hypothetical protein